MTALQKFYVEAAMSVAHKREQYEGDLAWMRWLFCLLEREPVLVELHDKLVRIAAQPKPIKERLLDLHAAGTAALPFIARTFAS